MEGQLQTSSKYDRQALNRSNLETDFRGPRVKNAGRLSCDYSANNRCSGELKRREKPVEGEPSEGESADSCEGVVQSLVIANSQRQWCFLLEIISLTAWVPKFGGLLFFK